MAVVAGPQPRRRDVGTGRGGRPRRGHRAAGAGRCAGLLDLFGFPLPSAEHPATPADATGRATTRVLVGIGTADYLVYERIHFSTPQVESIQITAPGYAPATVRLPRDGSTWRFPGGRIDAVLRVQRGPDPHLAGDATGLTVSRTGKGFPCPTRVGSGAGGSAASL